MQTQPPVPARPWPESLDAAVLEPVAARYGTPFYLYSSEVILERCAQLRAAFPGVGVRYAIKANSCPAILDLVRGQGFGIDAVSPWEVRLARLIGFKKPSLLYSPSNPADQEILRLLRAKVVVNVDSLSLMRRIARWARDGDLPLPVKLSLRVNLDVGAGHHPHVITAGPESKFGLSPEDIPEARRLAHAEGITVAGLHQHVGSGVFDPAVFDRAIAPLFALAERIPDLEFVDVGGGLGTPYRPDESAVDLPAWSRALSARRRSLESNLGRRVKVLIEPGRFLVAEAGVLVCRVTTVKRTADRVFVGVDTGMNHLIRPALYDAWHPLRVVGGLDAGPPVAAKPRGVRARGPRGPRARAAGGRSGAREAKRTATSTKPHHAGTTLDPRGGALERCWVVGQVCESADVIAADRMMVPPREGDLIVVGCAGAYGFSMASNYNLRPRPAELMLDPGAAEPRLVRARERFADAVRGALW